MRPNQTTLGHAGSLLGAPPTVAQRDSRPGEPRRASQPRVTPVPQALPSSSLRGRLEQLDGLRGIAALAVMFFHYFGIYPDVFESRIEPVPHAVWGAYGVHLFFTVSGFVILMTLSRAKRPSDFLIGRFVRLYPTYWAAVLLTTLVILTGVLPDTDVTQHSFGPAQVLANLTMFQSYLGFTNLDGVYWTLAFELAFYGWAFVLLATRQLHRVERHAAAYLLVQIALVAALEAGLVQLGVRVRTLLLLDYGHFFVAGMMFYRLRSQGSSWLRHGLIALACLAQALRGKLEPTLVMAGVMLIFYAIQAGRLRFLGARPLAFLGSISYALYAIHEVPGWALMHLMRQRGVGYWPAWLVTVSCAVLVAWLITRFIERPLMPRLKQLLGQLDERLHRLLPAGRRTLERAP